MTLTNFLFWGLWWSVLAGIIYTFNLPHWDTIGASITNIMSTQYLPFFILFLHLGLAKKQWRYLVLAGIALAACIYTDWYNTLYLCLYALYLLAFLLYRFRANLPKITRIIATGVFGLILGSPLLILTLLAFRNSIYSSQLGADRDLRASAALSTTPPGTACSRPVPGPSGPWAVGPLERGARSRHGRSLRNQRM